MRRRRDDALSALVPPLLLAAPGIVAVAALFARLVRWGPRVGAAWALAATLPWLLALAPMWLVAVVARDALHVHVLLMLCIGTAVSLLGRSARNGAGWCIAASIAVALMLAEGWAYRTTFAPLNTSRLDADRLMAVVRGAQAIGPFEHPGVPVVRAYQRLEDTQGLSVGLEIRAVDGQRPETWYTRHTTLSVGADGVDTLAGAGADARAWRVWTPPAAIGGRTLLLRGEWRVTAWSESGCGPVAILVDERPWLGACASSPGQRGVWEPFEVAFQVPTGSARDRVRVHVGHPEGAAFDLAVRALALSVVAEPGLPDVPVRGVVPAEVAVQVTVGSDAPITVTGVVPDATWQRLDAVVERHVEVDAALLVMLRAPGALRYEVRGVDVVGAAGPRPRPARTQAWFGHPNVAGHTLVAIAVMVTAGTAMGPWSIPVMTLAVLGTALTGSRSAFAVLVVVGFASLAMTLLTRRRSAAAVRVGLVGVAVVVALGVIVALAVELRSVDAGADADAVSRVAIWRAGVAAIGERPWRGWGSEGAPGALSEALAQVEAGVRRVDHAHNLWLELGLRFGLPGILAAIWWSAALVRLAVRVGPMASLAVVLVLALNLIDVTLWVTYVWLPVVALLQPAGEPSVASSRARSR